MPRKNHQAAEIQRSYYTKTAARYDSMHAHEASTDPSMSKFVHALLRMVEAHSVLDVGTATGNKAVNAMQAVAEKQPLMAGRISKLQTAVQIGKPPKFRARSPSTSVGFAPSIRAPCT